MEKNLKRFTILSIGTLFILIGFLGLFLPFIQGIIFLFIGLLILSKESKTAQAMLEKWCEKHPQSYHRVMNISHKVKNWLRFARQR